MDPFQAWGQPSYLAIEGSESSNTDKVSHVPTLLQTRDHEPLIFLYTFPAGGSPFLRVRQGLLPMPHSQRLTQFLPTRLGVALSWSPRVPSSESDTECMFEVLEVASQAHLKRSA